jgi:LysR family glycine cleavage system transcriptional activator
MRDLPLNALRAFAAIYLTGGIRPAGRLLGVSHSSVARHLSELEAMLGTSLVERTRDARALAFTAAGETLGREAAGALGALDSTWSSIRERRGAGTVTISAAPSVAALWLLPRLHRLAEALPRVEVSVLAEQRVRAPSEEGSDLAIRMGGRTSGDAEPLMDDALTPVAAPRLLSRARTARGGPTGGATVAALLSDLPLLHDRDPNAGWPCWIERHGSKGLDASAGPRFTSSDLVLRAAKLGQGVALARLRLAGADLADGSLERLTPASVHLPDAYQLVADPDRREHASVRAVRDWLHAEAAAEGSCS